MPEERIAKFIAHAGICSRRDAEKLIEQGRVVVNGELVETPAYLVSESDKVVVDGVNIKTQTAPHMYLYYKPVGLLTTHKDTHERPTIFDYLPADLPRLVTIGRLDMNSEGLLLLTTSGEISRFFELPQHALTRTYHVRIYGDFTAHMIKELSTGLTIEGVTYQPIAAKILSHTGKNAWVQLELHEGKNREIRNIMAHFDVKINRLLRVGYGPFDLGDLEPGQIEQVPAAKLKRILAELGFCSSGPR